MTTDYAEMEREFLSSLEADTGRDLAAWMSAIREQNLAHRNDIIDWLRHQGFMFAWASWLERIHHNGGRPIYLSPSALSGLGAPARKVDGEAARSVAAGGGTVAGPPASPGLDGASARPLPFRPPPLPRAPAAPYPAPGPPVRPFPAASTGAGAVGPSATGQSVTDGAAAGSSPGPAVRVSTPAVAGDAEIAAVLARGKAYRILAEHLLREIRVNVPGLQIGVVSGCIWLSTQSPFGALAVSARDVRLGLAARRAPSPALFAVGRLTGGPASISHVAVLSDARQVTPELLALVREASAGPA